MRMDMGGYVLILATLIASLNFASGKLRILDLKVPSTFEYGSGDEVILDCDFEAKDEEGLEVKWFYGLHEQIYQWIPNHGKPQALGSLKDHIDLSYNATDNPTTMYRALKIKDVTPELSGDYMCKITSFFHEEAATKKMIIYEPAKEFEFIHLDDQDKVICTATRVYPEPELKITVVTRNGTNTYDDDGDAVNAIDTESNIGDEFLDNQEMNDEPVPDENSEENHDDEDNRNDDRSGEDDKNGDNAEGENEFTKIQNDDKTFNLTRVFSYKEDDLQGITEFICELSIPETTYVEMRLIKHYTDNGSGRYIPGTLLLVIQGIILFLAA